MDLYFWNAYKRLEKEVLELSEYIHISDDQLGVYSLKIGDLLVRTAIEAETLVKLLYHENGGTKLNGKDLYFDTDCFKLLEDKWTLSKKVIYITSPSFFLKEFKSLCPLHKAYKRGSSSSNWQRAYQAVKHDRVNNQKSGNIGNLLLALGALYILNIYYRGLYFSNVVDRTASNIDWSLGSELFSVKISPETSSTSVRKIYEKKEDYDEAIYLVKHTDDTAKTVINLFDDIQNEVNKNTSFGVTGRFKDLEKAGKIKADKDNLINQLKDVYNDLHDENFRKELEKRKMEIHQVFLQLKLEAVLNTNQYKDDDEKVHDERSIIR